MGYVAIKGGQEAISAAAEYAEYLRLRGDSDPLQVAQIRDQLRLLVDRVMGEGSLYAPDLAALALKQAEGDPGEAAFILRAYRSTVPRRGETLPADTREMRVLRRISAAFKEIPGGQVLGPTRDYSVRLLNFDLADEGPEHVQAFCQRYLSQIPAARQDTVTTLPHVVDLLREEGLLTRPAGGPPPLDITRQPLLFPAPRSARLQALARGETGAMVCLAYSTQRGYGTIHPVVGELRVGYLPVRWQPEPGGPVVTVGEVLVTEAQIISEHYAEADGGLPQFTLGYGIVFGQNETKAIAMGMLDRALSDGGDAPANRQEFVLYHIDGIESAGFTAHYKLPHYVTFQSTLDRLRTAREKGGVPGAAL